MANIRLPIATRNAMLDAALARANLGSGAATLSFYTAPVFGPDDAITTQTLLGTVTMADPAFAAAAGGVADADTILEDPAADTSGTHSQARLRDSNGTTVMDFSVGVAGSGAALIVGSATTVAGLPIEVVSLSVTIPSGA